MEKKVPERKVSLRDEDIFYIYDKRINRCIKEDCEGTVKYGLVLKVRVSEEETLNCFECNKCHMKYSPYPNYVRLKNAKMLTIYNQEEVTARDQKRVEDAQKQANHDRAARGRSFDKPFRKNEKDFRKPFDKKPYGKKSYDDKKPYDQKPYQDRKSYDKKPYEQKPYQDRKPYGQKTYEDRKPYGQRPYEDRRPYGQKSDEDRRPYGQRPSEDRKPYGQRPYEDRRPYEQKQTEKRPYQSQNWEKPTENRQEQSVTPKRTTGTGKKSNIVISTGNYHKSYHSNSYSTGARSNSYHENEYRKKEY